MTQEHVRLKALELKAFRSWKAFARLEFPETGLTLLRGPGSGSGKSSVAMALAEALGVCPVPATRLATWGEKRREVAAEFQKQDETLRIERASGAKLVVNGEAKEGSPKYLNEHLAQFLGVRDLEWLKPLTYRPQRSRSFFLSLSDADKKAFLGPVCGLDTVEKALEESEKLLPGLQQALNRALGARMAAESALGALPQQQFDAEALAGAQAAVESARLRVQEAQQRVLAARVPERPFVVPEALVQEREAQLALGAEASQRSKKGHEFLSKTRHDIEEASRKRGHLNMNHLQTQSWQDSAKKDLQRTQELVSALDHRQCPTCAQDWDDAAKLAEAQKTASELEGRIAGYQKALDAFPAASEAATAEYERLRGVEARYQKGLLDLERAMAQAQAAAREVDRRIEAESRTHAQAERLRSVQSTAAAQQALLQEQLGLNEAQTLLQVQDQLVQAESRRAKLTADLQAAEAVVADSEARLALEQSFQDVLGPKGFLGQVVAEILDEVSEATNRLLERLPNVAHVTLRFETTQETAAGKVKSAITPVFRAHGHELAAKGWDQDLSGGQAQAVELAVDLAVAQVLGARTGASPGWLILDEPFVGLGREEIEQALEVLRVVAEERLVVVIDHAPWAQEAFDSVIDVAYENGYSVLAEKP